jgi:predicted Fe-S protein YdhL (DUF1289 family)
MKEVITKLILEGCYKGVIPRVLLGTSALGEVCDEVMAWQRFYQNEKNVWKKTLLKRNARRSIFLDDGSILESEASKARKEYLLSQYEALTREYYEKQVKGVDTSSVEKRRAGVAMAYKHLSSSTDGDITDIDIDNAKDFPMEDLVDVNEAGFACCPFHEENTPSFKIYSDDNRWHCFGCGESGDTIDFIQRQNGVGFIDAVKLLKDL